MSTISFKSRIIPVTTQQFENIAMRIGNKNSINFPWTTKESVLSNNLYTKDILDCTGCFISDGEKVFGMHLCPTTSSLNFSLEEIANHIKSKIDLSTPNLQAVLIGSQNTEKSNKLYNNLKIILQRIGIPASELKEGFDKTNIAYRSTNDEYYINNKIIDKYLNKGTVPELCLEKSFKLILVSDCDKICNFYV